jgi:hypothetical protein
MGGAFLGREELVYSSSISIHLTHMHGIVIHTLPRVSGKEYGTRTTK